MKLSLGALVVLAAGALVIACSDSDAAPANDTAPPVAEGGALPPAPDAGAPVDAGAHDADAEAAAPRTCSDDGFCHTVIAPAATLRAVWSDGQGTTWAVSEEGAIFRHSGTTWTMHAQLKGELSTVWGSGPTDVWVGGTGGIFHGTGASSAALAFDNVGAPGDERAPITSIWGTGPKDIWAAGSFQDSPYVARILHYTDGFAGASWQVDSVSRTTALFTKVFGTPASGVWIAGVRNRPITIAREVVVMRRAVGDAAFSEVAIPGDPQADVGSGQLNKLFDAASGADNTVWVLGRTSTSKSGFSRGTSPDGVTYTWSFVEHGPSVGPLSNFVWGKSSSDHWVGGEYGRLRRWDGTTWTQAKTTITQFPDITPLNGIWGNALGDLWVVGDGIAMYRAHTN